MKRVKYILYTCFVCFYTFDGSAQERKPRTLAIRTGLGSSVATRHFFTNDLAMNQPSSPFVTVAASTNLRWRENKSLFVGIEMQALTYFPVVTVKDNLGFASLLLGKSRDYVIADRCYLRQTNGVSLTTLVEASSSAAADITYTGNPFNNLNLGAFSNLQVLLSGDKRKNRHIDYGLGFDLAIRGFQIHHNRSYPAYLIKNRLLQYGLNINLGYAF